MSKSTVIQDIKSKIRPNGEQSITGQVLQDVLVESVNLVPEKVSELVNDSQYQTKANLDTALASKANTSDIPTKTSQLANDSGFMTSTEVSTTYATKAEVPTKTSQLTNDSTYQTKANLDTALATKADKSSLASKQDKLVSGVSIKTINDQSLLGSGNISIESGTSITVDSALSTTSENPVQNKVITNTLQTKANASDIPTKVSQLENDSKFATQTAVATGLATKADKDSLTSLEGSVSTLETTVRNQDKSIIANAQAIQGKQDKLVSGTNIKTVNNQSLLGSGNISIEGGGTITVDDALSDTSENPVQNKVITTRVTSIETSLGSKANASDIPTKVSQLENDSQYQTKANLDTALANYATTSEVNSKNTLQDEAIQNNADAIGTINQTLESKADTSAIPTKVSQLENDSDFVTSTEVSTNYATKTELANKANTEDVPTKTSQLENDSTYQTKANLDTALESYAKTSDVNSKNASQDEAIQSKQDKLVSGTNIKTINNQSLLGEGNISIEAGSSITVDSELSTTSENPVQNKVVTAELNKKPGYANIEGTPTLLVQGALSTSEDIKTKGMIRSRTARGILTLNDKTWYSGSDNKVDIFRWDGRGKGDAYTLTSDVDSDTGFLTLSLGNNTDTSPVKYQEYGSDYLGDLTVNCNLKLSGTPGKDRPEFQIFDFSGVREGNVTEWIGVYYVDSLFRMDYTDIRTGELQTTNLLEIQPRNNEFRVLGQNLVLQDSFDVLDMRVEDLENSLGDIDTALNTILGNS